MCNGNQDNDFNKLFREVFNDGISVLISMPGSTDLLLKYWNSPITLSTVILL